MMNSNSILQLTGEFQHGAEQVLRYEGNPYVEGDTVAEHIARGVRLITYLVPHLNAEFPEEENLAVDLYGIFTLHDDDEVLEGSDIVTYEKAHNTADGREVNQLKHALNELDHASSAYAVDLFRQFRTKDTLAAKIAKQIDNLLGNQLVIEQQIGLIAPYTAKFSAWYVSSVRELSGSDTIRALIDAQIEMVHEGRRKILADQELLNTLLSRYEELHGVKIPIESAQRLLSADLKDFPHNPKLAGMRLEDYDL